MKFKEQRALPMGLIQILRWSIYIAELEDYADEDLPNEDLTELKGLQHLAEEEEERTEEL